MILPINLPKFRHCLLALLCLYSLTGGAQQKKDNGNLYTAGHAGAFVGGLYGAYYPYRKLKLHGNFGLGAPDKLDGELVMLNGKIYQTEATGKTFEINYSGLTPFAVVNFFHADKVFKIAAAMNRERLYAYLDSTLADQNGIYAIHIYGSFTIVKTRAFPPIKHKPYVPLANMLSMQHFFTFANIKGDLVGYRIPAYMEGPNISGYHFHFLSDNKQSGGHMTDLVTDHITIEINHLNSFTVNLPQTADFKNYDFKKDRKEDMEKVENGLKN